MNENFVNGADRAYYQFKSLVSGGRDMDMMTVEKLSTVWRSFCCVWVSKFRSVGGPVWEQKLVFWARFCGWFVAFWLKGKDSSVGLSLLMYLGADSPLFCNRR